MLENMLCHPHQRIQYPDAIHSVIDVHNILSIVLVDGALAVYMYYHNSLYKNEENPLCMIELFEIVEGWVHPCHAPVLNLIGLEQRYPASSSYLNIGNDNDDKH